MSDTALLERTRALLLGLSALMFAATIVELVFAKHTDGIIQLIPFACCAVGLLTIALVWRTSSARLRELRLLAETIATPVARYLEQLRA